MLNPEHPPPKRRGHVDKEENVDAFSLRKRITILNGHAPDCSCILPASGRCQRGLGATNWDLGLGPRPLQRCVGASSFLFTPAGTVKPKIMAVWAFIRNSNFEACNDRQVRGLRAIESNGLYRSRVDGSLSPTRRSNEGQNVCSQSGHPSRAQ